MQLSNRISRAGFGGNIASIFSLNRVGVALAALGAVPVAVFGCESGAVVAALGGAAVGIAVGALAVNVAKTCDRMDASVGLKSSVGVTLGAVVGVRVGIAVGTLVGGAVGALAVNDAKTWDRIDASVALKSNVGVGVGGAEQDASGSTAMKSRIQNPIRISTAP